MLFSEKKNSIFRPFSTREVAEGARTCVEFDIENSQVKYEKKKLTGRFTFLNEASNPFCEEGLFILKEDFCQKK